MVLASRPLPTVVISWLRTAVVGQVNSTSQTHSDCLGNDLIGVLLGSNHGDGARRPCSSSRPLPRRWWRFCGCPLAPTKPRLANPASGLLGETARGGVAGAA